MTYGVGAAAGGGRRAAVRGYKMPVKNDQNTAQVKDKSSKLLTRSC